MRLVVFLGLVGLVRLTGAQNSTTDGFKSSSTAAPHNLSTVIWRTSSSTAASHNLSTVIWRTSSSTAAPHNLSTVIWRTSSSTAAPHNLSTAIWRTSSSTVAPHNLSTVIWRSSSSIATPTRRYYNNSTFVLGNSSKMASLSSSESSETVNGTRHRIKGTASNSNETSSESSSSSESSETVNGTRHRVNGTASSSNEASSESSSSSESSESSTSSSSSSSSSESDESSGSSSSSESDESSRSSSSSESDESSGSSESSSSSEEEGDNMPEMGPAMATYINNNKSIPFNATCYPRFANKTLPELNSYLGLLPDPNIEAAKIAARPSTGNHSTFAAVASSTLPANFTVNTKWPNCNSVFNTIQDQSNCGCDWAVSTASVIQDRRCIKYNKPQAPISSWDMVSCCSACQGNTINGCDGGFPSEAFQFYITTGVVTGGKYNSQGTCKPYPVSPNAQYPPAQTACSANCASSYRKANYSADKRHGSTFRVFSNSNSAVMQEIMTNGPVVATFHAYEDFFQYSSGVYQHSAGNLVGGHAVKIVGWGETSSGVKYWRVANSWGSNWGQGGFFNIIRGTNDCGFEEGIVSGTALKD